MNYLDLARSVFDAELDGVIAVRDSLGEPFNKAIKLFLATLARDGKIVVTGVGKNLHIAEKISATLASTGSTSVVLNPSQAIHGDLGILSPNDVLLALSYSGESDEIKALLPAVRRLGIPVIALTADATSALGKLSEVAIDVRVPREACPFGMAPTASTTATLAMGDAIAMTLLGARGFQREDYAKLHHGGAIGKALLLRAFDVMRTGEALAIVPETATLRDTVLAMTQAHSGAACVVDADGKLLGIFTDGDFRRNSAKTPDVAIAQGVAALMTHNPIHVQGDQLAVDILRIFEKRKIDDIPVVDADGKVIGIIDIQDLPKLKVF